jgi:aryl-alcohol dehydrogenase-like predicted oxidoreductase
MKYRNFGNTDLKVSELCYGTMRYASKSGVKDETSVAGRRALEEAIERGVNFIHSSYEYKTRWLTGSVLENHPKRHELHHIIKLNVPEWGVATFDKGEFRRQVEEALRELHTDRIAIVQHLQRGELRRELGYCAEGEPKRLTDFDSVIEPLAEIFTKMKQEGKVDYLTTFPYTVGYAKRAVESGVFSGVVAYLNLLETEMFDLFAEMKKRGQGFIGIRGLMAGMLTDRRYDRATLPADDRFASDEYRRAYDQLDALRAEIKENVKSWTDLALRFSIADDTIASTVVGINSPEQLHGVLNAFDGPRPSAELIASAHRVCTDFRHRFGVQGNTAGVLTYS